MEGRTSAVSAVYEFRGFEIPVTCHVSSRIVGLLGWRVNQSLIYDRCAKLGFWKRASKRFWVWCLKATLREVRTTTMSYPVSNARALNASTLAVFPDCTMP